MKLSFNPPDVNPPGQAAFGEDGVVIIRGSNDEAALKIALDGVEGKTPEKFIEAAVATGRFVRSTWGVHDAIELVAGGEVPVEAKKGRGKKEDAPPAPPADGETK